MANALMTALAKAQQEFAPIVKNKKNYNKGTYADLTAILEAVKPALLAHGIVILQSPVTRYLENNLFVVDIVTTICHGESGETFEGVLSMPAKNDAQAIGSAITYGRRYALVSMLSLSTEDDDDGEEAVKPAQPRQQPQRQAPTQRQPEPPVTNGNGHKPAAEAPADDAPMVSELQLKRINALGTQLYSDKKTWDAKRHELTAHFTNRRTESSKQLTATEADAMITALQRRINEAAAAVQTAPEEAQPSLAGIEELEF